MMQKFRFVGTEADLGGVLLDHLGQEVELDEKTASEIVLRPRGAALIPAAEFDSLGFTEEELAAYAYAGAREDMTEEAEAKFRKAWAIVARQQASYVEPEPRVPEGARQLGTRTGRTAKEKK